MLAYPGPVTPHPANVGPVRSAYLSFNSRAKLGNGDPMNGMYGPSLAMPSI